jgi:hypothetical protein
MSDKEGEGVNTYISQDEWESWPETRRELWTEWFADRGYRATEFIVDEDAALVKASVLTGDEGEEMLVEIPVGVIDVSTFTDQPGSKTRLSVPPYR